MANQDQAMVDVTDDPQDIVELANQWYEEFMRGDYDGVGNTSQIDRDEFGEFLNDLDWSTCLGGDALDLRPRAEIESDPHFMFNTPDGGQFQVFDVAPYVRLGFTAEEEMMARLSEEAFETHSDLTEEAFETHSDLTAPPAAPPAAGPSTTPAAPEQSTSFPMTINDFPTDIALPTHKDGENIKRPRNCRNLFRQWRGTELKIMFSRLSAKEITQMTADDWDELSKEHKKHWQDLAEQERRKHRDAYPERYNS